METAYSLFIIQNITSYQYSHFCRHALEDGADAKPERGRDKEKVRKKKIRVMCFGLYAFISIAHSVSLLLWPHKSIRWCE